ncbi:MAG: MotA/TolQ/ExbB proton channel family protein [Deltaproteobacteria bacterium]|nr:MotA/TolQ/ExbB proton channel family protein [Deltaproteobacteria bacterium]
MDIATILGIISAFSLIIISISTGSGLGIFINIPSMMIVGGGTLGATLINYPLKDVLSVGAVLKNAFFFKSHSPQYWISTMVQYAGKARKEGILSLESEVNNLSDAFAKKGTQLAIDGLEPSSIRNILETEIQYIETRHKLGCEIFNSMGAYSPAMGLIGTLIGLVQMLQSMDDPSTIGPAMAVALITTFYGAVMANAVFLPLAGKLKTRSQEELLAKELILEGIISICTGENPRVLEQKLYAFLSPRLRQSIQ